MVGKEEIVVWFSRQPSHQRLDVLCTLASKCHPFELRFLNTCVDFLTRKDTLTSRDTEILASIEKNPLPEDVDLFDENARRKLILTLAFLRAGNHIVADSIYRLLCNNTNVSKSIDLNMSLELHLIFTMILHHPCFSFEERLKIGKIYFDLQSQFPVQRSPANNISPSSSSYQNLLSSPSSQSQAGHGSNPGSPVEGSDQSLSSPGRKPVQTEKGNNRRNRHCIPLDSRNSPKNGVSNGVDVITLSLKDLQDKERVPRCLAAKLESCSEAEIRNLTDHQLQEMGCSPHLISKLRKSLRSITHHKPNGISQPTERKSPEQNQIQSNKYATSRSSMVKTYMGPPNVQPPFNNPTTRSSDCTLQNLSRAGSSSSTSSSIDCSPPSSPTEPNKEMVKNRKHFSTRQNPNINSTAQVPQPVVLPNAGPRPQSRISCATVGSTLRGANNNTSYLRPTASTNVANNSSSNCGSPRQPVQQQQQSNRAASQPREMAYPLGIAYAPTQQPQATPFIVSSSTPPPNLEAAGAASTAQPPLSIHFPYISVYAGDGASSYVQPPFTFITSPPPTSPLGNRPPGPHEIYPHPSYIVQGQVVTQPIAPPPPHGSNGNSRAAIMDMQPYLAPGPIILATPRPDADFSRPPPPGSAASQCCNCGRLGHEGRQCKEPLIDDIIKPSTA